LCYTRVSLVDEETKWLVKNKLIA